MLNEVQIEGLVARESWTYDKDLFFASPRTATQVSLLSRILSLGATNPIM